MDWQLLLVAVLVALSLVYLGRRTVRAWRGQGAGCGGCKCAGAAKTPNAGTSTLIPVEQIRLRRQ